MMVPAAVALLFLLATIASSVDLDPWCRDHCSSLHACNDLFGSDYVDLQVKTVGFSQLDGPGNSSLTGDLYHGDSVSKQTFRTQFVLDIAAALDVSPCRLYVTSIGPERSDDSWDSKSVFVTFRLFPTDIEAVRSLTAQIQDPTSAIFQPEHRVSSSIDPLIGLVAIDLDVSVKLSMDIDIIAQGLVKSERSSSDGSGSDVRYLNQGSEQWCSLNNTANLATPYCMFEDSFKTDVARTLELDHPQLVDVLFVKPEGEGSVVVSFRLLPNPAEPNSTSSTVWGENHRIDQLVEQISDLDSALYRGNVTFRVDPTWGVSTESKAPRKASRYLVRSVQPSTHDDAYERCKATHRCSRGWNRYNQSSTESSLTMQTFAGGRHKEVPLFADFEDWRQGTRGWKWSASNSEWADNSNEYALAPPGAHWSPFDFDALGPQIASYNTTSNNGLVLNSASLDYQLELQTKWMDRIRDYIEWLRVEMDTSSLDAMTRTRSDIRKEMTRTMNDYEGLLLREESKYNTLSQSQCRDVGGSKKCALLFNTSSLELTGIINATGVLDTTPDGTEVAVWAFDSIDIDENVHVTVTGQRAMALVSRSSVRINTSIVTPPGTLGGFPGGYSIARRPSDRLMGVCAEDIESTKIVGDKCAGDQAITTISTSDNSRWPVSNNVNGPGSASVRVYLKTIETMAPIEDRVQTITVDANRGQTLAGGFKLHFNGYSTPLLRHDTTALEMQDAIESALNPTDVNFMDKVDRSPGSDVRQGIGEVTVVRESIGTSGGSLWTVTYDSGVGIHGNLTATDLLEGKGSSIVIQTLSEGNSIGGTFSISFLGNTTTLPIPHDVSARNLERILLRDISSLVGVRVLRSDPTNNKCDAGLCRNGPSRSGGYVWTLSLATQVGNVSPASPTSREFNVEGAYANLRATNNLTGCVDEICPEIVIRNGHANSHVRAMQNLIATKPFSLSYGGAGGSHGGVGGQGFAGSNPAAEPCGDSLITNLHGGSGGALGLTEPFEIIMFGGPRARGGSGGGAIEMVAANDIVLGPNATISCNGQEGFAALMTGGGGGSGGTALLSAGGSIRHQGTINVEGGAGGTARQPSGHKNLVDGHGGGGGGGGVAMYAESIVIEPASTINVNGGDCSVSGIDGRQQRSCNGEDGTIHLDSRLWHKMHVDHNKGAAGTTSSLKLSASARYEAAPSVGQGVPSSSRARPSRRTLATKGGPEFNFGAPKKPGRLSFFVQIDSSDANRSRSSKDWGAIVEFRSTRWSQLATSNPEPSSAPTAFIGIHIGRRMLHGANIRAIPHDDTHLHTMSEFLPETKPNKWYKIDVRLNWTDMQYDILLGDSLVVRKAKFEADDGMQTLAIANFDSAANIWLDEIFVGDDVTMGFRCPYTAPSGEVTFDRPNRRGWKASEIGGTSYQHEMQRHESHVSRRALYSRDEENAVIQPFDGSGHRAYSSDVKFRLDASSRDSIDGKMDAGSILKVEPNEMKIEELPSSRMPENDNLNHHGQTPHTYVWYGEHNNILEERDGYQSASQDGHLLSGGVVACSTTDFVSWRNEGIMLHYTNLTDMVRGGLHLGNHTSPNPTMASGPYHVERPKVLYNNSTGKYVMWMIIDNDARDLAMAGIAVSEYATGPFDFVRSFYPDSNQTRDQTLFQEPDGSTYLVRSYYADVEFVLPSAIMQPTWESVKDADGKIDHALTYHRAHYEPQYDDYHDIHIQRWRTEDKPWKVICVDRITGAEREVPFGKEHLNHDGEVCNDPYEYKKVLGQGDPTQSNTKDGIPSRFRDPNNPANNAWRPDSVPGVKAQPWSANYRDGECGIRQVDDGKDYLDPNLPDRDVPDRGSCSNIADNPTHRTAPDKLIGQERVVETRRAKFIAISRLTDDYLDTTGQMTSFEGELEDGADLVSLFQQTKKSNNGDIPFAWSLPKATDGIASTFKPKVHSPYFTQADDFDTRYHQYIRNHNDRATYATSCQFDGECPVDFASQISDGHV